MIQSSSHVIAYIDSVRHPKAIHTSWKWKIVWKTFNLAFSQATNLISQFFSLPLHHIHLSLTSNINCHMYASSDRNNRFMLSPYFTKSYEFPSCRHGNTNLLLSLFIAQYSDHETREIKMKEFCTGYRSSFSTKPIELRMYLREPLSKDVTFNRIQQGLHMYIKVCPMISASYREFSACEWIDTAHL